MNKIAHNTTQDKTQESPKQRAADMRALARRFHALGVNVVPLGAKKAPVVDRVWEGRPIPYKWEQWKTDFQSDRLFAGLLAPSFWSDVYGVGGVSGPVSGNLVCIDFDKTDPAAVARFLERVGLPDDYPWTVRSGAGFHVWIRLDGDPGIDVGVLDRPSADGVGKVEFRWAGHYTALPGSLHPSGKLYAWVNAEPTDGPTILPAGDVLEAYQEATVDEPKKEAKKSTPASTRTSTNGRSAYVAKAVGDELRLVRGAANGSRNKQLNRSAFNLGTLVGAGALDRSVAEAELTAAALECGLGDRETAATIRSGLDNGEKNPRDIPDTAAGRSTANRPAADGDVVTDENDEPTLSERIEDDLREWGYRFELNELDDSVLVNGEVLSDSIAAMIRVDARDAGYGGKDAPGLAAMEDVYLTMARARRFHPVKDFLEALEWDGQDHLKALTAHFSDKHSPIDYGDRSAPRSVFAVWLWRWMIGAVAKVYADGAARAQNPMLVLSGGQSIGKSTFAAWLCPLPGLFFEGAIMPDSKDHLRYLTTRWVWEASELGSTTRRQDREALKAFLTMQDVTFRAPYARNPVTKPAMASFVGTVNDEAGILVDPTGNRRFLTVELTEIDFRYMERVDVKQLWAQVFAHWSKNPHAWRLLPVEVQTRDAINKDNEIERPFEGYITKDFDIRPNETGLDYWTPTTEIVDRLQGYGVKWDETRNHVVLGATLKSMGLDRVRRMIAGVRVWGYQGLRRKAGSGAGILESLNL